MYSSHTMFKKFLDDSSCWDVDNTLAAIIKTFKIDTIGPSYVPNEKKEPEIAHYSDGREIKDDDYEAYAAKNPDACKMVALIDQRNVMHRGDITRFTRKDSVRRPEGYVW